MKEVDISQTLRDAENALRDFIALTLRQSLGENWIAQCGVKSKQIKEWEKTKTREEKKLFKSGVIEERLLYYANFSDLETILEHHWDKFSDTFGDWERMKVWLDTLRNLRNPDAHRRELLPHQKYLAAGIAGEIRTRIVRSRNEKLHIDAFFPKIESVKDNYGNLWTMESSHMGLDTDTFLRVGDTLEYIITASDPRNEGLLYRLFGFVEDKRFKWQENHSIIFKVAKTDIGRRFGVKIAIKGKKYEGKAPFQDSVNFIYTVIPND